jgi:hypothetical protein
MSNTVQTPDHFGRPQATQVAEKVNQALQTHVDNVAPSASNPDSKGRHLAALFDQLAGSKQLAVFKKRTAGEALINWLLQHGKMYLDAAEISPAGVYWLDERHEAKKLCSATKIQFVSLLAGKCGRNQEDPLFKAARDYLFTRALDPESSIARRAKIVQFWTTQTVDGKTVCYLSRGCSLIKCLAEGVEEVPMGTDGVLMPEEFCLPEWQLHADPDACASPDELPFIAESGLGKDERIVFSIYLSILPLVYAGQLPPLSLEGPPASGKTTALVEAGRLFFGESFMPTDPMGKDAEQAIPRLLNQHKMVSYDNMDNQYLVRGFADRLAASTTGAASLEKTHYRNREVTSLPVNAAQTLSAVNMDFLLQHPTLSSRLLNLCWDKPRDSFNRGFVERTRREKRSSVLSFIAHTVSRILGEFKPDEAVSYRFDHWARCYYACSRVLGCHESASSALEKVLHRSQERGISADQYGAMLLEELQSGASLAGTAGEILDVIKHHASADARISPLEFGRWLSAVGPVARGLTITSRYDRHKKQNVYCVSRDLESD